MSLVVDASTALAAVLPDEASEFARAAVAVALDEGLVVPMLWMYEVQNGILMAVRRARIDSASADEALGALRAMRPELRPARGLGQEYRLAKAHALTSYDAAYIAVALEAGARLATNDKRLRNVGKKLGLAIFTTT